MSVLASIAPRQINAPDASYLVRPPTVREALVVMEAAPLAARGDADARTLLLEVMRDWFPQRLYQASTRATPQDVAMTCLQMLRTGEEPQDEGKRGEPVDYERMIALYMATYGVAFSVVLAEPWPAFILMLRQVGMVEARAQVNAMSAKGIPHIKNKTERERRIGDLMHAAGMARGPRRASEEEAAQNLKELELMFAQMGSLGRA